MVSNRFENEILRQIYQYVFILLEILFSMIKPKPNLDLIIRLKIRNSITYKKKKKIYLA